MIFALVIIIVILCILIVYCLETASVERATLLDRIQAGSIGEYKAYSTHPVKPNGIQTLDGNSIDIEDDDDRTQLLDEISLVDAQKAYQLVKGG